ncbi:MAG: Mut7-C RNAse domain-containing protein [Candidatus Hermodarchaeota archaeon]|nr:Mut7-C RNAse domain-containing protein [Candidatus Hermodarchaeota archaeon]
MEKEIVIQNPPTQPRFILDGMLGSLARWLRLFGYDTLYSDTQSDDEILDLIQDRVLLTRDIELIARARAQGFKALNPGEGSVETMLESLQDKLGVRFTEDPNRSRCSQCNTPVRLVPKEEVEGDVPEGSFKRHHKFWRCTNPACQKVYWQGRHWIRIRRILNQLGSNS